MAKALIDGIQLHYETRGESGDWIVLLNGIAMTTANWNPVCAVLERENRILLHDFRGQLLSDKPGSGYSLKGHADDLATLLGELGIGKAHIVGTSYGGEVAIEFALAHPDRTKSLVIIDSVTELDPLLESAVESWKAAAACDPVTFYRVIFPWNYSPAYIGENKAVIASREKAVAGFPPEWFAAFRSLCDAFLAIDQTPRLGDISCPTLVVFGSEDILKGRRFAEIIVRNIKGAILEVVAGAGHAVVIERPDRVAGILASFFDKRKK